MPKKLNRNLIKVGSFGDILPDQTIEVFIGAPLPGMVGPRKKEITV